jgi:hypothetical protein
MWPEQIRLKLSDVEFVRIRTGGSLFKSYDHNLEPLASDVSKPKPQTLNLTPLTNGVTYVRYSRLYWT